jgi:aminopeptidase N
MRIVAPLFLLLGYALCACKSMNSTPAATVAPHDQHSHARPHEVRVTHVSLDLTLDFERKELHGSAGLTLARVDPRAPLVLDAQNLVIERVTGRDQQPLPFTLGPEDPLLGSALEIELPPEQWIVHVHYRTRPDSLALQWLEPAQTAGKRKPFLLSQGQSILTRTWIPLQDSPGVRVTYDARIRCPSGMQPLMSAESLGLAADASHRFRLEHPIPSYLIALACGELEFRALSERCGVWAEPSVVAAAAREFDDTEAMVRAAERLYGPYRWGRYDLLVLPPSFPFGGMENPCLTFATPTILAGDKSLVGLVAHELAHSWSGNLVTNATWSDFWLNEGFTVYCENRIMEAVYGPERALLERELGRMELAREMAELEPWQQVLDCDLSGRNPDDSFSSVPYEKGALFLRRVEALVGRAEFDAWLHGWFERHAFESVTTRQMLDDLSTRLLARHPQAAALDSETWIHASGLPSDAPVADSPLLRAVDREVARWQAGAAAAELDTRGWVTGQWLRFLLGACPRSSVARLGELDHVFRFTQTGNQEVLCQWLELCVRGSFEPVYGRLEQFLLSVGRRKYLKPLYTALAATPQGLAFARRVYANARPGYHSVSVGTVDKLLGWP